MKKDVSEYVKSCHKCQINKNKNKIKIPLKITSTSDKPFQKIFLDIVGPLIKSNNNNCYIMTIMDDLTRYLLAIPLSSIDANTISNVLVKNFILIYGQPDSILTDQGSNFMSEIFKNVCKFFKIKKFNCTAYHPESNGTLERSHRTLKDYH